MQNLPIQIFMLQEPGSSIKWIWARTRDHGVTTGTYMAGHDMPCP